MGEGRVDTELPHGSPWGCTPSPKGQAPSTLPLQTWSQEGALLLSQHSLFFFHPNYKVILMLLGFVCLHQYCFFPPLSPTHSQEKHACNESPCSQVKVQRNFFQSREMFFIFIFQTASNNLLAKERCSDFRVKVLVQLTALLQQM